MPDDGKLKADHCCVTIACGKDPSAAGRVQRDATSARKFAILLQLCSGCSTLSLASISCSSVGGHALKVIWLAACRSLCWRPCGTASAAVGGPGFDASPILCARMPYLAISRARLPAATPAVDPRGMYMSVVVPRDNRLLHAKYGFLASSSKAARSC